MKTNEVKTIVYNLFFLIAPLLICVNGKAKQNKDSVLLSSPALSLKTHFGNLSNDNYRPQASILPFELYHGTDREKQQLSKRLKMVFDARLLYLDESLWPKDPNYVDSVNNKHRYQLHTKLPEIYLIKTNGKWLYSSQSISQIDDLFKSSYPFGTYHLVSLFKATSGTYLFGLYSWQLIGLLVVFVIGCLLFLIFKKVLQPFVSHILARVGVGEKGQKLALKIKQPFSIALVLFIVSILLPVLQIPLNGFYRYLIIFIKALIPLYMMFGAIGLVDLFAIYLYNRAEKTETKMDDQLAPIISKSLRVLVIVIGGIYFLITIGVDVLPLLAGVSLGGLAIALAAQDTLKNLFGSLMIFLDKPFKIGDVIKIDQFEGVVEEVGFRATLVRKFNDTLLYVPNALLADSIIDNYGLRTRRRYRTMISVTYDTPPEKIQVFIEGIRKILDKHSSTEEEHKVYLNDMAAASLDIILNVHIFRNDWNLELQTRHDVIMDILALAQLLDVRFAFPTQTVHIEDFPGRKSLTPEHIVGEEDLRKRMNSFFEN